MIRSKTLMSSLILFLSHLTSNPSASLLRCLPPKYIPNPTNFNYLHWQNNSPGHCLLPELWSSLPISLPCVSSCPLQSILHTLASCDFWKGFMKLHHPFDKAFQLLPTAIRIQIYPLCQDLQVFLIWIQLPHFPSCSSHSGQLLVPQTQQFVSTSQSLCLLILLLKISHPTSWHNCLFVVTHDSDQMPTPQKGFPNDPSKSSATPLHHPKSSHFLKWL